MAVEGGDKLTEDLTFAEPSSGAGAVAMLISETPYVFQIDVGANGYYGYEVMDTCRPVPDGDAGNVDLSLLSYLDCCEKSFIEYQNRVKDVDYAKSFNYLAFHTPFGGMIKGAHRNLMRKMVKASPQEIEMDFNRRVLPGLVYCQRVGNIMGAATLLSLISIIDNGKFDMPQRIGCFTYGSGCCSEFFSGVVTMEGQKRVQSCKIKNQLDDRYELSIEEYANLLTESHTVKFGARNVKLDASFIPGARKKRQREIMFLKEINEFHREYEWV
jgi:polyketide biosynthesis 3-hydroxy-3-methylglutaryl-CoA synthase-like enzyme PksG